MISSGGFEEGEILCRCKSHQVRNSLVINHEIEATKILDIDTGFVQQSPEVQVQVLSRRSRQTATEEVSHLLGPLESGGNKRNKHFRTFIPRR